MIRRRQEPGRFTIFCNSLIIGEDGAVNGYRLRTEKTKLSTVLAFQSIGYDTIAAGDSYNDLEMIRAGKAGFLFRAPETIISANPDIPAFEKYGDLFDAISRAL